MDGFLHYEGGVAGVPGGGNECGRIIVLEVAWSETVISDAVMVHA